MVKNIVIGNMESSKYDPNSKRKEVAFNDEVVKLSGNQVITGVKTFSSFPTSPSSAPTTDYQFANKKYVDDNAGGGGLSWGDSITSTSGTGITTIIANSASAGTIGQSIVVGDTQTNAVTGLSIDTGTSNVSKIKGFVIKSTQGSSGFYQDGICSINEFTSPTQAKNLFSASLLLNRNFNTNSPNNGFGLFIVNENNSGSGYNTGISLRNSSTKFLSTQVLLPGSGINIHQNGVGGTAYSITTANNIDSSTNGLVNYTLSNTQSGATVMQKIDTGTSAQGHTAHQILLPNASTSARGITINTSSSGTGIPIELITTGTNRTGLKLSTGFTSDDAPVGASKYINIDIGGVAYRILAQAVA